MDWMSEAEYEKFVSACDEGILCDPEYCPYMKGKTSRLGACEGDFCKDAWDEFCRQNWRDDL